MADNRRRKRKTLAETGTSNEKKKGSKEQSTGQSCPDRNRGRTQLSSPPAAQPNPSSVSSGSQGPTPRKWATVPTYSPLDVSPLDLDLDLNLDLHHPQHVASGSSAAQNFPNNLPGSTADWPAVAQEQIQQSFCPRHLPTSSRPLQQNDQTLDLQPSPSQPQNPTRRKTAKEREREKKREEKEKDKARQRHLQLELQRKFDLPELAYSLPQQQDPAPQLPQTFLQSQPLSQPQHLLHYQDHHQNQGLYQNQGLHENQAFPQPQHLHQNQDLRQNQSLHQNRALHQPQHLHQNQDRRQNQSLHQNQNLRQHRDLHEYRARHQPQHLHQSQDLHQNQSLHQYPDLRQYRDLLQPYQGLHPYHDLHLYQDLPQTISPGLLQLPIMAEQPPKPKGNPIDNVIALNEARRAVMANARLPQDPDEQTQEAVIMSIIHRLKNNPPPPTPAALSPALAPALTPNKPQEERGVNLSQSRPAPSLKDVALGKIKMVKERSVPDSPIVSGQVANTLYGGEIAYRNVGGRVQEEPEGCTFCLYESEVGISNEKYWLPQDAATKYCADCHASTNSFMHEWSVTPKHHIDPERLEELQNLSTVSPLKEIEEKLVARAQARGEGQGQSSQSSATRSVSAVDGKDTTRYQKVLFCIACPWRQVDITKIKICRDCRREKQLILEHTRHQTFLPTAEKVKQIIRRNIMEPDAHIRRKMDMKKLMTHMSRCMICTSPATEACIDCPLVLCGGCQTMLVEICKGYLDNLIYFHARDHIRNDAFMLRSDGGGF